MPTGSDACLSFGFQTAVADIDGTVEGEPSHPSLVLVVELEDDFIRVIVPKHVLNGREELLSVGRVVKLEGRIEETAIGPTHIASDLDLIPPTLYAH
jgi:hypothetical protein